MKDEIDASISESHTTPTPSKTQFNANAVEFVPGQFKAPNPAAPVFTPQFQLTPSGYVPINPYSMPYYMYVPTNGAGAPMMADGAVLVSPVLTYQATGGYNQPRASAVPFVSIGHAGKGGLSRHNSSGSRGPRTERKEGGSNSFAKPPPSRKEDSKSRDPTPESPVMRPEDFPSMLPGASISVEEDQSSSKPSWAAIARKPTTKVADKKGSESNFPIIQGASVDSNINTGEVEKSFAVEESVCVVVEEQAEVVQIEEEEKEEYAEDVVLEKEEEISVAQGSTDEQEEVKECLEKVYAIELLRRLRFHDSCRPTAESRASIPSGLLRQRKVHSEEAEDWRAEAAAESVMRKSKRFGSLNSSNRIEVSAEMLIPSENSWSVAQQKKDSQMDENLKVSRKIFAVLNKLTIEKFAKLSEQLFTECGISKPAHIITLVKYLFEKATIQHHFIGMYADLCSKCLQWLGSDSAPEELVSSIGPGERSSAVADIFKRVLLERCQAAFYSYFLLIDGDDASTEQRGEEEHHKHRLSMLGTVKFVAQLLERRLMSRSVFRKCLDTLLNPDQRADDHIECACVFLTEVAKLFEKEDGSDGDMYSQVLEEAMEELEDIASQEETIPRIRFAIMNLVDLRANKYVAKTVASGPSKIAEVHKQAAMEEQLTRSMSRISHAPSSQSLAAANDEWETVPKKSNSGVFTTAAMPSKTVTINTGVSSVNPWRAKRTEEVLERSSSSE